MHLEVVKNITDFASECGFSVLGLTFSPIKGPEGNIEYLMYIKKGSGEDCPIDPQTVVLQSHAQLDGGDANESSNHSQSDA